MNDNDEYMRDTVFVEARADPLTEESENEKLKRIESEKSQKLSIFCFFVKLFSFLLIIWVMFTFIFGVFQMRGESMYPRIRDGDLLMFYRLENKYCIGDVVTYEINGKRCTARIVAMGNDVVELDASGQLTVNGNIQSEEIYYPTEVLSGGISYPYSVPEGGYFLLCDFRTNGIDSRSYGAVLEDNIDGKIITVLRRRGI